MPLHSDRTVNRYIVNDFMQVKQCRVAAVAMDAHQELNAGLTSEETDSDGCVTENRQSKNSLVGDLHCLLPQHWTSVNDSQVRTPDSHTFYSIITNTLGFCLVGLFVVCA